MVEVTVGITHLRDEVFLGRAAKTLNGTGRPAAAQGIPVKGTRGHMIIRFRFVLSGRLYIRPRVNNYQ